MSQNWTKNKNYVTVGDWSWDTVRLNSKIKKGDLPLYCDIWQGSMSPTGALFGARKLGLQQMTQARRLVWMEHTGKDATNYQITMSCDNQRCVNPEHFVTKPNNRKPKLI